MNELKIEGELAIPGSTDRLVLTNYERGSASYLAFKNLARVGPDGTVRWWAELPEPSTADAWLYLRWEGGKLVGNSWSCFSCELDPETGRIRTREFTK